MKNIPVLYANGKSLAEAYEKALIELYKNGIRIKTQYDKPNDPLSIDATMNITIEDPLSDPMIHKAFPGSISDLREYVFELLGKKDTWIKNSDDPDDTRWEYTYSQRFRHYGSWKQKKLISGFDDKPKWGDGFLYGDNINQIDYVIKKLCEQPFTRQAQIITWMPQTDLHIYDPACLQSLWFRILEDEGKWYLNTNIRIRSNDSWNACYMNLFGLTMMIKESILDEISKKSGKEVVMSRLNWQADSWHIYGKDIKIFEERFINRLNKTSFEDRIYNFYSPDIQEMYHEEEKNILEKIRIQSEKQKEQYVE